MSDIRVFVTFPKTSTVFAGEKLECNVTFKNVSPLPGPNRGAPPLHLQRPAGNAYGLPAANGSSLALGGAAAAAATTATAGGGAKNKAISTSLLSSPTTPPKPALDLSHLSPTFLLPTHLDNTKLTTLTSQLRSHNCPLTPSPSTASLFLADINTAKRCDYELRVRGIKTVPLPPSSSTTGNGLPIRVVKLKWFTESLHAGRLLPIGDYTVYTATVTTLEPTPSPESPARAKEAADEERRKGIMGGGTRRDPVKNSDEDVVLRGEHLKYSRGEYYRRATTEIVALPTAQPQLPAGVRSDAVSPRLPTGTNRSTSGHKPSLSLSVSAGKVPTSPVPASAVNGGIGHKHKRSISIVSIGSEAGVETGGRVQGEDSRSPQGRTRGNHGRSSSLHTLPRRSPMLNGSTPNSAVPPPSPYRPSQPNTPMIAEAQAPSAFPFFPRPPSAPTTPKTPGSAKSSHTQSKSIHKAYKLPPVPPATPLLITTESLSSDESTSEGRPQPVQKVSHIALRSPTDEPDHDRAQSRVISAHSVCNDTPRSSGEFYSLSNSTTETLISEYDPRAAVRSVKQTHSRRHSLLAIGPRSSESLMMGYAQVSGSFTLDGSLIQTSIFDEVKRRGVVGQMGGGVIGLETNKSDGGFLSGFGWSSFGGGFGGLLGGNNMSSIAEMKTIASSKSIPILSTPQSILFVDLRLAAGESRTYTYSFTLPKGIPPSHRGKAIKVTYNLVIGTQRPGKGVQQPKVVEIPFRVIPHVEPNGSLHSHDLMSPIILLRDEAVTYCVEDQQALTPPDPSAPKKPAKQESSLDDFLSYVDSLLSPQNHNNFSNPLSILSPSVPVMSKRMSMWEEMPTSSKDAIELAILRGSGGSTDGTLFEIARNGRRVASLMLARPAYKLGETITAVIDFSKAKIPCYHINVSLETSETVTPSIALRSASSIHRATRKIHSQHSESTLFAKRVVFTPTIPPSATPEFSTSGVSNTWTLRLEFVTPVLSARLNPNGGEEVIVDDLLEQTHADDRGELFEARQALLVESFDASVPVKVYPNAAEMGSGGSVGAQTAAAAKVGYVV